MAFFTQNGGLKRCERWSNALQKVAFCSVKGHLLQSFRTCVIEALTVSRWFIALYVKCRKTPFLVPNGVFVFINGFLKGLNGFLFVLLLTLLCKTKTFITLYLRS